jgi:hypothetical protein
MRHYLKKIDKRILIGLGVVGAGVFYLKVLSPTFNIHIPCPFKHVTGFDCPGCGMTRLSLSLLEGDLYQAFRYNSLIFVLLPLFVLYYCLSAKGKKQSSEAVLYGMLVMTILFGVLRNTPMFSFLAPTTI